MFHSLIESLAVTALVKFAQVLSGKIVKRMSMEAKSEIPNPKSEILRMPGPIELVTETVDSYDVDRSDSSVLRGVDKKTLVDLGLILIDKDRTWAEALKWLITDLGEDAVSQSAFYRFAKDFSVRFGGIRQKYRVRIAKLTIDQAVASGGCEDDGMAAVLQAKVLSLMAQKMVDVDDLAQLEGRELGSIVATIDGWNRGRIKKLEIDLKREQAERDAQKLASDLATAELEREQLRRKVADLAARFETEMKARQTRKEGAAGKLSDSDIAEARRAIFGEVA